MTARWNHTVNVRMVDQVLAPGVQHAEETDLSAEVFGIGGELQQSRCTAAEQHPVKQSLVVERYLRQLARDRENHVNVGHG